MDQWFTEAAEGEGDGGRGRRGETGQAVSRLCEARQRHVAQRLGPRLADADGAGQVARAGDLDVDLAQRIGPQAQAFRAGLADQIVASVEAGPG